MMKKNCLLFLFPEASKKQWKLAYVNLSPELEELEKVLHFPEEVALALAETESVLFCQVRTRKGFF